MLFMMHNQNRIDDSTDFPKANVVNIVKVVDCVAYLLLSLQ